MVKAEVNGSVSLLRLICQVNGVKRLSEVAKARRRDNVGIF